MLSEKNKTYITFGASCEGSAAREKQQNHIVSGCLASTSQGRASLFSAPLRHGLILKNKTWEKQNHILSDWFCGFSSGASFPTSLLAFIEPCTTLFAFIHCSSNQLLVLETVTSAQQAAKPKSSRNTFGLTRILCHPSFRALHYSLTRHDHEDRQQQHTALCFSF